MTAEETADITSGTFTVHYRGYNSDDEAEYVGEGTLEVLVDLANESILLYDDRTHNEIVLDAIQATIQGAASVDQIGLSVGGRSLQRRSYEELLALETQYLARVDAEKKQAELGTTNSAGTIQTRMP